MTLRGVPSPRVLRISGTWRTTLAACVLLLTLVDTVLLGAGTGFLTNGFNSAHIDWVALVLVFLPVSLLLDLWLVMCVWLVAIPLLRAISSSSLQVIVGAVLFGAGIPAAFAAARYNVYARLGDMFSVVASQQFSKLGASDLALEAFLEVPYAVLFASGALFVSLLALRLARRLEERRASWIAVPGAPSGRRLLKVVAALSVLNAVAMGLVAAAGADLRYGFDGKVSGRLVLGLLDLATDLDRDGYGLVERPIDSAPLDASVHPYAIDVPGNAHDENDLAGDHPADFSLPGAAGPEPAAPADGGARPHLLLIYLESFRADLLERRSHGREVTPFLLRLAREGSASGHAYTHSPWTLDSREQLFTGRVVAPPGVSTLIDDFASRGYRVAYFSGQDESYGNSGARLGTARADVFYDARQDVERRTSRSTAPVSLQVSWRTLCERVIDYLEETSDARPLFLYVNLTDTHFPYWHSEIDDLLGVAPLLRSEIRQHNAERVREAYANTAANVDRAAARITEAFRAHIQGARHAILVTADHGQALYEGGMLGHGQTLDVEMTRVPFVLWGVGGDWPEPIGPTDVRALLLENLGRPPQPDAPGLAGEPPRARFVPDPERRVFQYVPGLERPTRIGLQGLEDRLEYGFGGGGRLVRVDTAGVRRPLAAQPELLRRLVWPWEALQTAKRAALETAR
jgi:hypothetical protein